METVKQWADRYGFDEEDMERIKEALSHGKKITNIFLTYDRFVVSYNQERKQIYESEK